MDEHMMNYEEPDEFDEDEEFDEFDSIFKGTIRGFGGMPMSGLATLIVESDDGNMEYLHCDNGQTARSLEMAFGNVLDGFSIKEDGGHIGKEIYYCVDGFGSLEWFIPVNEASEEFINEYNKRRIPNYAM